MAFNLQERLVRLSAKAGKLVELAGVDLGQTPEPWDYCSPVKASKSKAPKKYYPSLSIYHTSTPLDIPDAGKATVDYVVRRRTTRTDQDGKTTHDYEVEIRTMDPEKEEKGSKKPVQGKTAPGAPAMGTAKRVQTLAAKPTAGVRETLFRAHGGYGAQKFTITTGDNSVEGHVGVPQVGVKAHLKRNAGTYIGAAAGAILGHKAAREGVEGARLALTTAGALGGFTADTLRGAHNIKKAARDNERNARFKNKQFATAGVREVLFGAPTRNDDGQFSPTDSGTISPQQATAAYGHPKDRLAIANGQKRASGKELLQQAVTAKVQSSAGVGPDSDE